MHVISKQRGPSRGGRHLLLLLALACGVAFSSLSNFGGGGASAREGALDLIAFDRDGQIVVANPDGSSQAVVFDQTVGFDPSWSKTGKIAFTASEHAEDTHIAVMNEDGAGVVHLPTQNTDRAPAFSPDGQTIAFTSERAIPNDDNPYGGSPHRIWLMNADGTNQRKMFSVLSGVFREYVPSFSPDGQKIAFIGERTSQQGTTGLDVYVANADGQTPAVRLTHFDSIQVDFGAAPAWSPDGQKIAFSHARDIKVVNADGSGQIQNLTNSSSLADSAEPAFSPDGQKIVYSANVFGSTATDGLYTINADGTGKTFLGTAGGRPTFRPRDVEPEPEPTPTPEPEPNPEADLSVTISATPASPYVGQNMAYTVVVKNNGPSTAANAVVNITRSIDFNLGAVTPARGACAPSQSGSHTTTCTLGDLQSGEQVSVNVAGQATASGEMTASASVGSATPDPVQNNNLYLDTLTVRDACVEEVTGEVVASISRPGNQSRKQLTHTIRVRNTSGRTLHGLIHFVLDGLHPSVEGDKGVNFFRTRCAQPLGRKYTSIGVGAQDLVWLPGQTVEVEIPFSNLDRVEVNYNLRIYTGPGYP
ncbi:MAG TPA: hypothetical protein VEY09_14670 [Pyrinomonadaceae bacterium]|nr:hypothetical protein [Pyrinomonadaceae bacterium]